ncbi:MAG: DUF1882 domain-containing protein [Sulfurovum sp.]|nr:DUF1882 domain-containing protein [Sulfurovum sp.]
MFDLEFNTDAYYIKRATIVEKIAFNNRTFYAKFERIDEALTPLVLQQHHDKDYTIALPLLHNNRTQYLLIEYKGEAYQRFYHLIQQLFKSLSLSEYTIYQGKTIQRLQVFIKVDNLSLEDADTQVQILSNALKEKMDSQWKALPSLSLPDAYNIVTLPYKAL